MINANETLNQLTLSNNGANRLVAMIGAKNLVRGKDYVAFKFMSGAANKANYIKITLSASDLYNIEFGYIRGLNYTVKSEIEGLFADQLFDYFQNETKLALKL